MKTALKVLFAIIKIVIIIFAIVGVTATIVASIICRIFGNHFYDVVEETDDLDPDDEDQDLAITTEAYRRTLSDPRVMHNKFVRVVGYGVGRFSSFVANL